MRGMRRVANEDDVLVKPRLRSARATNVDHGDARCRAFDIRRWPFSHGANNCSQAATVPSRSSVSKPACRHDASSHSTMNVEVLLVEAVAVRLEHAVLVFDEVERECLERKRRAEPDESGLPHVEVGPEMRRVPWRGWHC